MHLIQLLITLILWIDNQVGIWATQTSTIETNDLEDGHPNHQLWRKMIDIGRPPFSDRANFFRSDSSINTVEEFLDTLINSSRYDRRIRPFFDQQKACNVTMTIHINTISAINEVNMDYNTDLIFRQSWYDPRLNYSGTDWATKSPQITLHYSLIDRIWVPDSFFRNAKEGKRSDITVPNRLIRIHRDGKVLYSQRLLLKLDCQMKLQKFPLDNQTCVVNIGSYAFSTNDLAFFWEETQNVSAIRVNEDLEMPDFVLSNHEAKYCNRTTATGSFTCLLVVLHLKRLFGYYLVQVYIPSMLIVILSFVSFWIDHKSVRLRKKNNKQRSNRTSLYSGSS
jgi:anionic glutamate receptor